MIVLKSTGIIKCILSVCVSCSSRVSASLFVSIFPVEFPLSLERQICQLSVYP